MRSVRLAVVGAAVLLAGSLATADDKDTITVNLKAAKFKPAEGAGADLFGYNEDEGKLFFYTNGAAELMVKVPADGDYQIAVKASGDAALNERAKFKLAADGQAVGKETQLTADEVKEYPFTAKLKAGEHKLSIEFTNDVYKQNEYDRNLYVHGVTVAPAKKVAPKATTEAKAIP
jgi:hypothetical protein